MLRSLQKVLVLSAQQRRGIVARKFVVQQQNRTFNAAAAAGTSKQKRALNPEQIQGKPTTPPTVPPPAPPVSKPPPPPTTTTTTAPPKTGGTGGPPKADGNNTTLLMGVAGVVVVGGGAYYMFSGDTDAAKQPPQKLPEVKEVEKVAEKKTKKKKAAEKKEEPESTPAVVVVETVTTIEEAATAAPTGGRVTSITVPDKMKNKGSGSGVDAVQHPPNGNRVSMVPPSSSKSATPAPLPPVDAARPPVDASMTQTALAELQQQSSSTTTAPVVVVGGEEATESLLKSHQSLWTSVDVSYFQDLDSLTESQLKARVVQLATELRDRTKWEAVRLKEFLSMKEKETAETYIELMQKQRLEFEDLVAKRLRDQETQYVRQMQQALNDKDAAVQSLLNAALEAQKEGFEEEKKIFEQVRTDEIQMTLQENYLKEVQALKKRMAHDLQSKVQLLERLSKKLQSLESAVSAGLTSQQGSMKAHRLSAAAIALSDKLETSQPVKAELNTLKTVAGDVGVIGAALATIPDDVQGGKTGVPTLPQLQARFEEVNNSCRQAALVPTGRLGLDGQLAGYVFSKLKYPPSFDDAAPTDADKNHPEYVLARAKQYVQLGELALAVEQLDFLTGQAAFTVQDWKRAATNRIKVDKAVKVIKMECALINESCLE